MKIDKIYCISLDAGVPELQSKVLANLQALGFEKSTGYEIMQAWNGREDGVPEGYAA